jgi:small subunit ribosomal protein S3Ae
MAIAKGIDKWKLKKWFSVYAPKTLNGALVGEMPANDEKSAVGRNIIVSLDTLTHNPSHAYTNISLKVTEVKGEAAQTRLMGFELLSSYIRSFVRRYRSISTAVIPATSKDGTSMVVKLIAVTRQRTAATKTRSIRHDMSSFTNLFFKENNSDSIVAAMLEGKFQAEMGAKLGHIAGISKVEVRKLEIVA